jgi:hypothetical protein
MGEFSMTIFLFWWNLRGEEKVLIEGNFSKGEKVRAKAHGGPIDIQGLLVAKVDEKVRLQAVEVWFDPLEMFRQMAPVGVVEKAGEDGESEVVDASEELSKLAVSQCPVMKTG